MQDDTSETSRPFSVDSYLYKPDSDAYYLEKLTDCLNPELNSISNQTLVNLIES